MGVLYRGLADSVERLNSYHGYPGELAARLRGLFDLRSQREGSMEIDSNLRCSQTIVELTSCILYRYSSICICTGRLL